MLVAYDKDVLHKLQNKYNRHLMNNIDTLIVSDDIELEIDAYLLATRESCIDDERVILFTDKLSVIEQVRHRGVLCSYERK